MKKIITPFLLLVMSNNSLNAQIGIQTSNPQGPLHIDSAKDNPATGNLTAAQQANDVIINSIGNVGIGTSIPTNKLEVNSGTSGVKITQLPSASILSTDANGNIISGNSESAGVNVTKQYLIVPNTAVVLNSGSGKYSFRYSGYNASTLLGGTWQIRINDGVARQFNVWDTEYTGAGGGSTVYQARNVVNFTPGVWAPLNSANGAGGANEYNVYHVYDSSTGVVLRFTCTLSNMGTTTAGIRESMILEEF
jgi:hypothetical protein